MVIFLQDTRFYEVEYSNCEVGIFCDSVARIRACQCFSTLFCYF